LGEKEIVNGSTGPLPDGEKIQPTW